MKLLSRFGHPVVRGLRLGFSPFSSRRFSQQKCWKCSVEVVGGHFCSGCNAIQPPSKDSLFAYIGLPQTFGVDDNELKKKFRDLQFLLHPDKFAQSSTKERELSEEHSRRLNEVYKTLSDPLARANYLLSLQGDTETQDDLDPETLLEMMEWNEHVAALGTENELQKERKKVQKEIDGRMAALGEAFEGNDFSQARHHVTFVTYLYSIRNSIDQKIQAAFS